MQYSLFSASAKASNLSDLTGEDLADEGIDRAEKNSDPAWKTQSLSALFNLCVFSSQLTVDDLCQVLSRHDIKTHNPSALGAIMRHGAAAGWMKKTGEYVKSKDPKKHSRVLPVWRSLLFVDPN